MKNILLIHGALGASAQFNTLKEKLADTFNVYTLEFPGHGKTRSTANFSIPIFAESLKDFIYVNQLQQVTIFGYSMGGYVALYLASKKPELIEKIITLGTKFDWNPESALKESQLLNPEKIQEKVPAFAKSLESLHGENWKNVLQQTASMMIAMGEKNPLNESDFNQIKCACILGVGDSDTMVSQEETKRVANWIKNSEFYLLENTIHPIEKVSVEKLIDVIGMYA